MESAWAHAPVGPCHTQAVMESAGPGRARRACVPVWTGRGPDPCWLGYAWHHAGIEDMGYTLYHMGPCQHDFACCHAGTGTRGTRLMTFRIVLKGLKGAGMTSLCMPKTGFGVVALV